MKKEIKKFLEFNGKTIYFLAVDGEYWIAIKPICEALGVDYDSQIKNMKESKFLSQRFSEQYMVATDGKLQKMICLPEAIIYGWIFQIESNTPGLEEFKRECFKVLNNNLMVQ